MSSEQTTRTYEITLLFRPDLSELDLQKAIDKTKNSIVSQKGEIIKESSWGKKSLSYPIQKHEFGFYHTLVINLASDALETLTKELELSTEVLRYMILSLEKEGVTVDQLFNPAKEEAYIASMVNEKSIKHEKPREKKTTEAKTEASVEKESPKIDQEKLDEKIEELLTKEIE